MCYLSPLPQNDSWIITRLTERQLIPTRQNNHASHSQLDLISHCTRCSCLVWQVAISLQISLRLSLSLSLDLSLVTDVLNQWHPNSFTALFPWAWGFVADAFGVKSLSSRARPSLMHLGVGTITHAICTNCSICVWIWNAFPEYDWRPYLSPKRAVEMWGIFYPSLRLSLHLLFVMSC